MRRGLALGLGLVAGLVAFAPARMLLPAPPLAAAAVHGSLWHMELAGAALGRLALGDMDLALQPAALLKGRLQWAASGAITGQLWRSVGAAGVSGASGRLGGSPLPGLPLAGVTLADATARFDGSGRCTEAGGQVTIELALPLAGQRQLAGAPRCNGSALLLPLASSDGRLRLDFALNQGRWTARMAVSGAGVGEAAALVAAGFRSEAGMLVKEESGA